MSQHSEDRLEESAPELAEPPSARILPFERPQSELQRAVQLRAQETMELERDRKREATKPAPLRWFIVLVIALIPVILMFGAVDAFLRVIQQVGEMYSTSPVSQPQQSPADASEPEPAQPGVVLLQPLETSTPPAGDSETQNADQAGSPESGNGS